jgi:hypothetical protein
MAFEPVPHFYHQMSEAFASEPKVSVHNFGLSDANRTVPMELRAMGTSEFSIGKGHKEIDVDMRDVRTVFEDLHIEALTVPGQ